MPLNWLNRFTPGGFREPREVAEKCNSLGIATETAIQTIEDSIAPMLNWNSQVITGRLSPGVGPQEELTPTTIPTVTDPSLNDRVMFFRANGDIVEAELEDFPIRDPGSPVTSVFTRLGDVVAQPGDYTAAQVTNVPAGGISATDVQAALNALDGRITALDARVTQNEADIALLQQIIVETRVAFHGAVLRTTDDADSNIGAGYQPLDNFETIAITPRGCSVALNGEFSFDREGAWELAASFNLSHNESNQGRETNIRLFNVTTATPGQTAPIAIGRNQPGTNWYNTLPFTLLAGDIGDTYRLEIGGGDTLSSVVWNQKQITLRYLGEVGGLIDPTP